uniref:Cytochrome b n=1 Tax=Spizellomyces punctatus TaxID=109760 RepID=CYB_SPIPN|nr:apocytochrome b [Spizellomyces punctatus]Q950S3.1 RecName: Full=Cytochrome b; AltName: Full=Complex III subunit 3; AltName: Full=Complex III subunit III; AltName: Full=Cytochrome b-c1 complex subunit 3; AltName: Full=Ubiquinol-cytochrome-c reductase complex cytochrome b subunit [Spizellomyces punctatus]AAK84235.1 apocytochrome b [Spizellomyces punctatus]
MKLTKRNPILVLVNDFVIDSPLPTNLTYFWNFGSLLGVNLVILIISGLTLAMHYTPNTLLAFSSVEHIMRDVNNGWLLRYIHANGASFFFIWVYLHIGRNLYYGSYRSPRGLLWSIGVVIFILMMATAFIGYVLPWGQMSFWGATVITNLLSAIPWIGTDFVLFVWGGFSVDNATLNRFFSLHYLLPFILAALVVMHLLALHQDGSNNPEGISSSSDRLRFHPYFTSKDLVGFVWMAILLSIFVFFAPYYLGHPDNSIPANPLVTPHSIVPEWYFLPFYAILRAIPSKLGGVIAMFGALLILFPLALIHTNNVRSNRYRPLLNLLFWIFVFNFFVLLWVGAKPIAQPYILIGQISTIIYFLYFVILMILGCIMTYIYTKSNCFFIYFFLYFGCSIL